MKRLISLITVLTLILQFGIVSGFAAATPDKTLFKDVTEIYGVYDCSYNYSSVLEFSKSGIVSYERSLTEKRLMASEDYSFKNPTYLLSKDKKNITATFTFFIEGVQYQGQYAFKKDPAGKVYFNATHFTGSSKIVSRGFSNLDACIEYLNSSAFSKTYLAEKSLYKKLVAANSKLEAQKEKFEDTKPITAQNLLLGYYTSSDYSQYLTIDIYSAANSKDYTDLHEYTAVMYTTGAVTFNIIAKNFTVKDGVALYLEDSKNYAEIKATSRGTITNIKIVKNGKVVTNTPFSLTLMK